MRFGAKGVVVLGLALAVCARGDVDEAWVRETLAAPVQAAAEGGVPPHLLLHAALTGELARAGAAIRAEQEAIGGADVLSGWQKRVRASALESLGGFPERTPLNARVTASVPREGYRIEKVLFESRPKFYVTGLLFLPDPSRHAPPYPGVLVPCGHSKEGKALPGYQRGALLAAVNGIAAFVYDPMDQGERLQGGGAGVHGHNITGYSAALLGLNTATFRIWDGMRALDYLASRPEVDAARLGCMGNSGGGTLTAYLSALDGRIVASAPACYISSLQHVCGAIGPQDAEQNLFGQMAFGLEHSGWLLLRATRPTCICAAQRDFFPVEGARQTFGEVQAVYRRLGAEERLSLVEHDGTHGWAEPLRLAGVGWMKRWLGVAGELAVPPEEETGVPEKEAWVTAEGQVMRLADARSVYDLMRDEAGRLAGARGTPDAAGLRRSVRRCAGIRPLEALPVPLTAEGAGASWAGGRVRRVTLSRAGALDVAAVLFAPESPKGLPVLLADGSGKTNTAAAVCALLGEGRAVLVADVCGFGETYGGAHTFYGAANRDEGPAVMAYLLGRSLVGMRAEDLLVCARWLSVACGAGQVELRAANWAVTPALHAAAAEPQLFGKVSLADEPKAWEEVVAEGARHRFADVVHGALREYTLGDLKRLAAGGAKAK